MAVRYLRLFINARHVQNIPFLNLLSLFEELYDGLFEGPMRQLLLYVHQGLAKIFLAGIGTFSIHKLSLHFCRVFGQRFLGNL
jgi:hypothetical protein